jgi:peptidoglycan/LPS O-acetylase OafA/YrhL
MIIYATFLRALAAILITNSHYTGVYPIDLIANGGLLGDVLFFSLSGFVLVNIRVNFVEWYKKRILRIYPSIWRERMLDCVNGNNLH